MTIEAAVHELEEWQAETGQPLPRDTHEIAHLEYIGKIVDLDTGQHYTPTVDWLLFASLWLTNRRHFGRDADPTALATAIQSAEPKLDRTLAYTLARHTLPAALAHEEQRRRHQEQQADPDRHRV